MLASPGSQGSFVTEPGKDPLQVKGHYFLVENFMGQVATAPGPHQNTESSLSLPL